MHKRNWRQCSLRVSSQASRKIERHNAYNNNRPLYTSRHQLLNRFSRRHSRMTQYRCKSKWCSNRWLYCNSNSKSYNKCKLVGRIMRFSHHPWVKYSSSKLTLSITNHRSKQINSSSHRRRWAVVRILNLTLSRNSKLWRTRQLRRSWAVLEPTSDQKLGKQPSARRNSSYSTLSKCAKL